MYGNIAADPPPGGVTIVSPAASRSGATTSGICSAACATTACSKAIAPRVTCKRPYRRTTKRPACASMRSDSLE